MRRLGTAALAAAALIAPVAPAAAQVEAVEDVVATLRRSVQEPPAGTWHQAAIPPDPDGRYLPQMVYAPELGRLILFGGFTERGVDDDLYSVDLDAPQPAWIPIVAQGPGPAARTHAGVAWDSDRHRLLVFGGAKGLLEANETLYFGGGFLNDLWALNFDPSGLQAPRWEQLAPGGVDPVRAPGKRAASSAIYDPLRKRLVVFGGNDTVKGYAGSLGDGGELFTGGRTLRQGLNEVWAFDLQGSAGWNKLGDAKPGDEPELFGHQAIYDPASGDMIVTGGIDGVGPSDYHFNPYAFRFELEANRWTRLQTTGASPAMAYAPTGYSSALGALVVGRGLTAWDDRNNRKWVYALTLGPEPSWTQLPSRGKPHPVTGFGFEGGAVVGGDTLALFGGLHSYGSNGEDSDATLSAYSLTSGRWKTVVAEGRSMSATTDATAVYDPERRHMYVVFGRRRAGQVWDLDLATGAWSRIAPGGAVPDVSRNPLATYDFLHDRLLVLGTRKIHALEPGRPGSRWTSVPVVGDAPSLGDAEAVYDPVRDRLLVVGGTFNPPAYAYYFGSGQLADANEQVMALHLSGERPAWRELDVAGAAPRVTRAAIAYDPIGDRIFAFGGRDASVQYGNLTNAVHVLDLAGPGDGSWRQLSPAGTPPSARADAVAAFDTANNRVLVYGGSQQDGATYALDLSGATPEWRTLTTTADPVAREGAAGIYDSEGRRLVIHSGLGTPGAEATSGSRDTYALALGGQGGATPAFDPQPYAAPAAAPVRGGAWAALGPYGAQAMSVALSPQFATDRTVYAGTAGTPKTSWSAAGIYVSRDGGTTWTVGEGDVQGGAIVRIAPAPSDPMRVYAAGRSRSGESGVFVSHDAGATWQSAGSDLPSGNFYALAVHPTNPDLAWVAPDGGGLYMTVDGGGSWTGRDGFEGEWVYGLAAVPRATGVRLLAAARDPHSDMHGAGRVYSSDDLGTSWELVLQDDDYVTYGFAHDPSNPERVLLSAGSGIWRSDDGGTSWTHLDDRAIHASWLAFDPTSNGRVAYASGVAMPINFGGVGGGTVSPAQTPGLFRSTDGGASWDRYPAVPEEDFGGVAVSADGDEIFAASMTDGVYVARDHGATFSPTRAGFTQALTASIAIDAVDPDHMVAAAHYDGVYVSDDGGTSWTTVGLPDGEPAWYAIGSPVKSGRYLAANYGSLFKSEDGGDTWTRVPLGNSESPGAYFKQPGALVFDPKDADTWYVLGSSGAIFVTHDNGGSFAKHQIAPSGACLLPIAIHPRDARTLLVGDTCGRGIFRSRDGGTTWEESSTGLMDRNVTALAFNPLDPDEVFAGTLHEGVFRSTDGGATWSRARYGLGYRYVKALTLDTSGNSLHLFAATEDSGVYESDDHGTTWTQVRAGMVGRGMLHITNDNFGRVLVATDGGGVLRLDP